MTPVQARMARAALNLSSEALAAKAVVPVAELLALESGSGSPDVLAKMRGTFEGAGIEFLGEDGVKHHPMPADSDGSIRVGDLNAANDE